MSEGTNSKEKTGKEDIHVEDERKKSKDIYIIEAALFVSGEPISVNKISKSTGINRNRVVEILEKLKLKYEERDTSLEVRKTADKFVMQVSPEYAEGIRNLAPIEISTPILRTLAVISFQQPIKQSDLVDIRGNKAYRHVKKLEKKSLINCSPYGRTKLIETTNKFIEYLGIEADSPKEVREKISERFSPATFKDFFERKHSLD